MFADVADRGIFAIRSAPFPFSYFLPLGQNLAK
jgi:hypothetical protein